jgi:hypothetical protein
MASAPRSKRAIGMAQSSVSPGSRLSVCKKLDELRLRVGVEREEGVAHGRGLSVVLRDRLGGRCHELHHHLRDCWEPFCYAPTGELGKMSDPRFRNVHLEKSPDLLVHLPETRADLETLWRFDVHRAAGYEEQQFVRPQPLTHAIVHEKLRSLGVSML